MDVTVEHSIESVAGEWAELADRVRASPFVRPGWIAAWHRTFGEGDLHVMAGRRAGRLVAVLPLLSRRASLRSPTNAETPEFGLVAEDRESARRLAEAVFAERRAVSLWFVERESAELGALSEAAAAARHRIVTLRLIRPPYLTIRGSWEEHVSTLSKNRIKDLRRKRKNLGSQGELVLDVQDGSERLEELLAEGFGVEHSGWKLERGTAIVSRPELERFYRDVAGWAAREGSLRLAFLRLDRRPLAFVYGLERGGVYYYLKGGYDPGYDRSAPGKLLTQALLERAFSHGLERFEFLGTDDPWKLEWTTTCHERCRFMAFPPSVRGVLGWSVQAYGRPVARGLRVRRALDKLRT